MNSSMAHFRFFFQDQTQTGGGFNPVPWIIGLLLVIALFTFLAWRSHRRRELATQRAVLEELAAKPGSDGMIPETGAMLEKEDVILPPAEDINQGHINDPVASSPGRDDFTIIEGIGPAMQEILYEKGINTYEKLAGSDPVLLKGLLQDIGLRFVDPSSWPEQARQARQGHLNRV